MIKLPSKPSKLKQPKLHERNLYEFIKKQTDLVSYHNLQRSLEDIMTSGAFQGAVKRCLLPDANFKIYEGRKISEKKDRLIRVFSVDPSKVSDLDLPELSVIVDIYENIKDGNIFKEGNNFFLPLKMNKKTTQILKEIVEISENHISIGDLFSKAIMKYLEESVSKDLIEQARQNVEEY